MLIAIVGTSIIGYMISGTHKVYVVKKRHCRVCSGLCRDILACRDGVCRIFCTDTKVIHFLDIVSYKVRTRRRHCDRVKDIIQVKRNVNFCNTAI